MSITRRLLLVLALAATLPVHAADAPTPDELERGLVGHWRGALTYRDYQNDRRYELPVTLRIDTPIEVDYYKHGGILPFVLRQLLAA